MRHEVVVHEIAMCEPGGSIPVCRREATSGEQSGIHVNGE